MIEQTRPRGRHRAPNRTASTAVRVSAAVAVSGGLVATVAAPADAATGVGTLAPEKASHAIAAPNTLTLPAAGSAAGAVSVSQVRLPDVVEARDLIKRASRSGARTSPVDKGSRPVKSKVNPSPSQGSGDEDGPVIDGSTRERIIAIAKRYIGTPYSYGSAGPGSFDCSGFTSYVFRQVGIDLPRSSRAQRAAVGRTGDPQPGDLVFSGSPVHHVGIYLGNGMVIDAPKPGGTVQVHKNWGESLSYGNPY
ncbi:C40 family peptidase [Luteipulveratus mongoliensis]|uniref:NlpC/P60 domain-containing protein n=1 Tax=Luteipulveratus mongoliensis TaxID=571913 RepID=A0A0K1JGI9_9MICO|nr:NlpC/P60 family protein [Luteipulveratus mongoliensis]AKU15837.1 hypothetical protein VV02_08190 [Luteipulveratus mongoliensis]